MNRPRASSSTRRGQQGLSLVELLVAVVIALVVVLIATQLLLVGESHKRSTTSTNDVDQSGAFAAYALDRAVRSAGSGFSQSWDQGVFGCRLNVWRGTAQFLPRDTDFPQPFKNVPKDTLALAPVLIGQGMSEGGSDVLIVMGGNASAGDVPRPIRSAVGTDLRLDNTVGLAGGELGLITEPGAASCLLVQIGTFATEVSDAIRNEVLPLAGAYSPSGALEAVPSFAASEAASFSVLGIAEVASVQFQMFGVDADRTLVAYDLLRTTGSASDAEARQALADGVAELYAIYGVDESNPHDNTVDKWVAPTGDWALDKILADPLKMRRIMAVRVALVMRASHYEKEEVATQRPELFGDTDVAVPAVDFSADAEDRHFRLRVVDTTIPLRNSLLLAAP